LSPHYYGIKLDLVSSHMLAHNTSLCTVSHTSLASTDQSTFFHSMYKMMCIDECKQISFQMSTIFIFTTDRI